MQNIPICQFELIPYLNLPFASSTDYANAWTFMDFGMKGVHSVWLIWLSLTTSHPAFYMNTNKTSWIRLCKCKATVAQETNMCWWVQSLGVPFVLLKILPWEYLNSCISQSQKRRGKNLHKLLISALNSIEMRYHQSILLTSLNSLVFVYTCLSSLSGDMRWECGSLFHFLLELSISWVETGERSDCAVIWLLKSDTLNDESSPRSQASQSSLISFWSCHKINFNPFIAVVDKKTFLSGAWMIFVLSTPAWRLKSRKQN